MQRQLIPPWQSPCHSQASHIRNSMPCPLSPREPCNIPCPALVLLPAAGKLKQSWKPSPSSVNISCKALPAASRAQRHEMCPRAEPCSLKIGWIYYWSKHVINIKLCVLPADTFDSAEPAQHSRGVFICRSVLRGATAQLRDGRIPA